jgi:hypothetical protein
MSREAERKRLVKLIQDSVDGCAENWARVIADHLLENGVIVPPCKVGDTVYVLGDEFFWEVEIVAYSVMMDKWEGKSYETVQYMYKGEDRVYSMFTNKIGKEMFFSKAEAEYALKNRRSVSLVDGHIEE